MRKEAKQCVINDIIWEDLDEIYHRNIDWERFRNCTILITGAYGMLASYVVFMLIYLNEEHNFNIHIIANGRSVEKMKSRFGSYCQRDYFTMLTDSINEPIKSIEHGMIKDAVECDSCNRNNRDDNIDYIIHAASLASPQYYAVCPVDVLTPNVLGTYHLLNLAVAKSVKGFLLFSTGDIYGTVNGVDFIAEKDIGIIDPLDIHSCYGESKRMAETMCYSFYHQYGVPARILRIWHTYAPTMDIDNDPRVFASFMKNIINGQDIEIKSDGSGKRTFCYVADAISALFLVLTKGKDGEAYNVCNTEQFISIRELAENLADLRQGIKVTWVKRNSSENYTENTMIRNIAPSNIKLKRLGWETKYNLKEGFRRVLEYQKHHYNE